MSLVYPSNSDMGCRLTKGRSNDHHCDTRSALPRSAAARASSWAAIAGATLPELMHRLGHKTHTAALRYQHSTSERHREVADRLGALLTPAGAEPEALAEVVDIAPR